MSYIYLLNFNFEITILKMTYWKFRNILINLKILSCILNLSCSNIQYTGCLITQAITHLLTIGIEFRTGRY